MLSPERICLLGCAKRFSGLLGLIVGTAYLYSETPLVSTSGFLTFIHMH